MNEDRLIEAIRARAARSELRNDFADRFVIELGAPATTAAIDKAERAIGYALHPFHRRLLTEVGNGGFGPGYGLVGLPGGNWTSTAARWSSFRACCCLNSARRRLFRSPSCAIGAAAYGDASTVKRARFSQSLKMGSRIAARPSARGSKTGYRVSRFGEGSSQCDNSLCKTRRRNNPDGRSSRAGR